MSRPNYIYCPYCATKLEPRERYSQLRPVCPQCGFVHFLDPKVAVIGLVTHDRNHDREVLLIQRGIDPGKGLWALPGGYMDAGEMPEAALQRELLEEVGLQVEIQTLLTIFPMVTSQLPSNGIVLAYHAHPTAALTLTCDDDACAAGWFTPDRLPAALAFESTHTLLAQWQRQLL